jgi:hypothetical protein
MRSTEVEGKPGGRTPAGIRHSRSTLAEVKNLGRRAQNCDRKPEIPLKKIQKTLLAIEPVLAELLRAARMPSAFT